jgi:hypothetical protein
MADPKAAARLKQHLKIALANFQDPDGSAWGWYRLAIAAGVSTTTIENWIYGRTVPRANEMAKVARALRPYTTQAKMEAAYAGVEPEEPPVIEALRELIPDLHELVILLRAQADQAVVAAVQTALEERRQRRGEAPATPPHTPPDTSDQ